MKDEAIQMIKEFHKIAGYKMNTQKSIALTSRFWTRKKLGPHHSQLHNEEKKKLNKLLLKSIKELRSQGKLTPWKLARQTGRHRKPQLMESRSCTWSLAGTPECKPLISRGWAWASLRDKTPESLVLGYPTLSWVLPPGVPQGPQGEGESNCFEISSEHSVLHNCLPWRENILPDLGKAKYPTPAHSRFPHLMAMVGRWPVNVTTQGS